MGTHRRPRYAFVGAERGNFVAVYDLAQSAGPEIPPGAAGHQRARGAARDPAARALRRLQRGRRARGQRAVHHLDLRPRPRGKPEFPTLRPRPPRGVPIGWGALSGLTADPRRADRLWSVSDSYYTPDQAVRDRPRHRTAGTGARRGLITSALTVTENGSPLGVDGEGLAARRAGGFWLAAEGGDRRRRTSFCCSTPSAAVQRRDRAARPRSAAGLGSRGLEGIAVTGSGAERAGLRRSAEPADHRSGRGRPDRPLQGRHRDLDLVRLPARRRLRRSGCPSSSPSAATGSRSWSGTTWPGRPPRSSGSTPSTSTRPPDRRPLPMLTKSLVRDLLPDLRRPTAGCRRRSRV